MKSDKQTSWILPVSQHVARNPVARAIERTRLKKFGKDIAAELRALGPWAHCPSIITGVSEALAIAIKTIEGFEDPDDIGGVMVDAVERCVEISGSGFVWDRRHCEPLIDALDCALQILAAQDPKAKVLAWQWAQQIERAELAKVAA